MATIIFGIVAVILTTLIIITMCRLGKLETDYSDLLNDLLKTNGNVSEHKERLDAHFQNIAKNLLMTSRTEIYSRSTSNFASMMSLLARLKK